MSASKPTPCRNSRWVGIPRSEVKEEVRAGPGPGDMSVGGYTPIAALARGESTLSGSLASREPE